jgi:hypothetical protein
MNSLFWCLLVVVVSCWEKMDIGLGDMAKVAGGLAVGAAVGGAVGYFLRSDLKQLSQDDAEAFVQIIGLRNDTEQHLGKLIYDGDPERRTPTIVWIERTTEDCFYTRENLQRADPSCRQVALGIITELHRYFVERRNRFRFNRKIPNKPCPDLREVLGAVIKKWASDKLISNAKPSIEDIRWMEGWIGDVHQTNFKYLGKGTSSFLTLLRTIKQHLKDLVASFDARDVRLTEHLNKLISSISFLRDGYGPLLLGLFRHEKVKLVSTFFELSNKKHKPSYEKDPIGFVSWILLNDQSDDSFFKKTFWTSDEKVGDEFKGPMVDICSNHVKAPLKLLSCKIKDVPSNPLVEVYKEWKQKNLWQKKGFLGLGDPEYIGPRELDNEEKPLSFLLNAISDFLLLEGSIARFKNFIELCQDYYKLLSFVSFLDLIEYELLLVETLCVQIIRTVEIVESAYLHLQDKYGVEIPNLCSRIKKFQLNGAVDIRCCIQQFMRAFSDKIGMYATLTPQVADLGLSLQILNVKGSNIGISNATSKVCSKFDELWQRRFVIDGEEKTLITVTGDVRDEDQLEKDLRDNLKDLIDGKDDLFPDVRRNNVVKIHDKLGPLSGDMLSNAVLIWFIMDCYFERGEDDEVSILSNVGSIFRLLGDATKLSSVESTLKKMKELILPPENSLRASNPSHGSGDVTQPLKEYISLLRKECSVQPVSLKKLFFILSQRAFRVGYLIIVAFIPVLWEFYHESTEENYRKILKKISGRGDESDSLSLNEMEDLAIKKLRDLPLELKETAPLNSVVKSDDDWLCPTFVDAVGTWENLLNLIVYVNTVRTTSQKKVFVAFVGQKRAGKGTVQHVLAGVNVPHGLDGASLKMHISKVKNNLADEKEDKDDKSLDVLFVDFPGFEESKNQSLGIDVANVFFRLMDLCVICLEGQGFSNLSTIAFKHYAEKCMESNIPFVGLMTQYDKVYSQKDTSRFKSDNIGNIRKECGQEFCDRLKSKGIDLESTVFPYSSYNMVQSLKHSTKLEQVMVDQGVLVPKTLREKLYQLLQTRDTSSFRADHLKAILANAEPNEKCADSKCDACQALFG